MSSTENTFKFGTFLWLLAGLIIPFWPISLPVCWFMAYRSYRSGTSLADQIVTAQSRVGSTPMPTPTPPNSAASVDLDKWNTLIRYDDDISHAVAQLEPYGAAAIDKLRVVYTALNDKSKLDKIVADIQAEFQARQP